MPAGALVQIPTSVSRGGKCKTNLRGVTPSAPYDYVNPTATLTGGAALGSISTAGSGNWSNTIPFAYYSTSSDEDSSITYPGLLSSAVSGTLLFRIYIQPQVTPPQAQTVFANGRFGLDGYGIPLTYDEVAFETYEYNLHFARLQDASANWIKLNTTALSTGQWYQFSIRFETSAKTTVTWYQDGTPNNPFELNPITTPTDSTSLMGFFGRMTDIALLEDQLTNSQLALFGTAPYI